MRLMAFAACGAMIAACTQNAEPLNSNMSSNQAQAQNDVLSEHVGNNVIEESASANAPTSNAHPCLTQGHEKLDVPPTKALGTEPFWGVKIEGRCLTYSTPEDQAGTRIWTKYQIVPDGKVWTGTFQNQPFKLILQAKPECSDGMSDRTYPTEALLTVAGEERRGCAFPE